jgi:hypothetical protein
VRRVELYAHLGTPRIDTDQVLDLSKKTKTNKKRKDKKSVAQLPAKGPISRPLYRGAPIVVVALERLTSKYKKTTTSKKKKKKETTRNESGNAFKRSQRGRHKVFRASNEPWHTKERRLTLGSAINVLNHPGELGIAQNQKHR